MSQTLTQTTAKRLLGLPAVARLMMFARHEGPAVLLSTTERLALFRQSGVFTEPASVNPSLSDWSGRREKVVLDLNSALRPFPVSPERYALTLTLGQEYPREGVFSATGKLRVCPRRAAGVRGARRHGDGIPGC